MSQRRIIGVRTISAASVAAVCLAGSVIGAGTAFSAPVDPGLATAASFGVLAGAGITNTGATTVTGDIGTAPNPAITGADITFSGTKHQADAVALIAKNDLQNAYTTLAGEEPKQQKPTELGGQTLKSGVYNNPTSFGITGTLTLDAEGDPNAVFVFQAGTSTLITASGSQVAMINGAQACNVFWQVGSSATLGTGSVFVGNILAQTSIQAQSSATIDGRLLALTASVTLDNNTIFRSACVTGPTTPTTTTTVPTTTTPPADTETPPV